MDDEIEIDVLAPFQRMPHKGLARIVTTLNVLGIATVQRKWVSRGDEHFPRLEYLLDDSTYRLGMGVTREPFKGHISWASLHAQNENEERSATVRLCFREEEKRWLRGWNKGLYKDPRLDSLIATWFPKNEPEVILPEEGLVNATLQHLINLLFEG